MAASGESDAPGATSRRTTSACHCPKSRRAANVERCFVPVSSGLVRDFPQTFGIMHLRRYARPTCCWSRELPPSSIRLRRLRRLRSSAGAIVIEINPDETPISPSVDHSIRGKAGEVLPQLLE